MRALYHFIYLAAGYSVRFGSNKLLYEIDGVPMYRHVLDRLLEIVREGKTDCDVTVVTQYSEIMKDLAERNVPAVINPDPKRGISSSVKTGIEYLMDSGRIRDDDFLIFINADQPGLKKETIAAFVREAGRSGKKLAALAKNGEMYSPCMFHADLVPRLLMLQGDRGGKSILRSNPEEAFLFETEQEEELVDIDTLC